MALCLIGQAVLFRLVFVLCLLHKSALPSAQKCHAYAFIVAKRGFAYSISCPFASKVSLTSLLSIFSSNT
jgi:hypothetical protein